MDSWNQPGDFEKTARAFHGQLRNPRSPVRVTEGIDLTNPFIDPFVPVPDEAETITEVPDGIA